MEKLLIIDGNSIINRAFYGIRMLTNAQGMPTNAVYGFLNIFLKQLEELAPDYVAVAFDMRAKTFRHLKYEAYKANRKGMPEELAVQLPALKDVLAQMRVKVLELEGYEADDIIGTVSRTCKEAGLACYISTGDKDDLQLAGDNTQVMLVTTKNHTTETKFYSEAEVKEAYGLTPAEFVDLKAIMGDKSDNIPGVNGIGEVGAKALIQKFGSVEAVYEQIESPDIKPTVREKLLRDRDMAFLSKELATIDEHVPLSLSLDDCRVQSYDREGLAALLRDLGFQSLLKRMGLDGEEAIRQPEVHVDYALLTASEAAPVLASIRDGGCVYYLLRMEQEPSAAFCGADGRMIVMHGKEDVLAACRVLMTDPTVQKVGNNMKEDMLFLSEHELTLEGDIFDTAIGAYLLFPSLSIYDVQEAARNILGEDHAPISDDASLARSLDALLRLKPAIERQIEEYGMHRLFYEIELPLVRILFEIQQCGFLVDRDQLAAFSELLDGQIQTLTEGIYTMAGCTFNINSTKQLGEVLFEKLGLPVVRKTKRGYSTDVEVLSKLRSKHEIIDSLLEYRTLTKLKSTYADGLHTVINPHTGKIHSRFNQTVTQTGRLSSTEPNLQNIPVRTELGREIRKFFVAGDGCLLVDADYSQIELRVLAHISGDESMIQAFLDGTDIHSVTASQAFGTPLSQVTPEMRRAAKAVNFGIVYGISDFGLSQDLKIPRKEAKRYIDAYFTQYPGVKRYMDEVVEQARQDGYVTTMFGRRRYLPELSSNQFITRSFGERMALNTPIQGTAADIIKIAMVRVSDHLKREGLAARLILQVHDELIVEAPEAEVERVKEILRWEMEHAADLRAPLVCDMNVGRSWYDAK